MWVSRISGCDTIIELNIQNNKVHELGDFPNLIFLDANNNDLCVLNTYSSLATINIEFNKLSEIKYQPKLKKLIANNNLVVNLGYMPLLTYVELRYNKLKKFVFSPKMEFICIQFNPSCDMYISKNQLLQYNIKEMELDPDIYKIIYDLFRDSIGSVQVQINTIKLRATIKNIPNMDNETMSYVYDKIKKIKHKKSQIMIFQICMKLYYEFFSLNGMKRVEEIIVSEDFKKLYSNIFRIYHKSIVIIIFFLDNKSRKK